MAGNNRPPRPRAVRQDGWRPGKIRDFLRNLALTANVTLAAKTVNKVRCTVYTLRERDASFRAAMDAALDEAMDDLFAALFDRAKNGAERKVFYQGKECGTVLTYSDNVAMRLLALYRPTLHRKVAEMRAAGRVDPPPFEAGDAALANVLHRRLR